MNLLMFNLAVDENHVTLGFGIKWIEALARRFDHVDVVTMTAGTYKLPSNVTVWSLGREKGFSEWRRAMRFYAIVIGILRKRKISVAFTHMIPIFAVLFWPLARVARIRNVLWYAHGATPLSLRIAHRLVDQVVASTREGFRLPSSKVSFIGQGIDEQEFRFRERSLASALNFIAVGRLSRSKGLDILIDALASWSAAVPWRLTVIGAATNAEEESYAEILKETAKRKLGERVRFTGRLNSSEIAAELGASDVFLSFSRTGSLDKAIVEAMATGCIVVSTNDSFRSIAVAEGFPFCAPEHAAVESIHAALDRLQAMNDKDREALRMLQADVARRDHTLASLMARLTGILKKHAAPQA